MSKVIAIVTGASSGIGRLIALSVAEKYRPDELWVAARSREKLEALQAETDVPVRVFAGDLSRPEGVLPLRDTLGKEAPCVRFLVHASGFGAFDEFGNIPAETSLGMIDLNCRALVELTHAALPYLAKGSVVMSIASVAAFAPIPYGSVYAASKAFVLSFSRALGRELKPRGVRTVAVCPYWTATPFIERSDCAKRLKIDRTYPPAFVAEKAVKALGGKRDYVVPGAYAKLLHALSKLLPHSLVMRVSARLYLR